MDWNHANRAIRDHAQSGCDLLFFERAQRKDGLWRFRNNLHYSTQNRTETGQIRSAIIFGLRPLSDSITGLIDTSPTLLNLPPLEQVDIAESKTPLMSAPKLGNGSGTSSPGRRSRNSGPIGKRAEEVARRYLLENATALGAKDVRWVADDGETPGWDIEYTNDSGELVSVEVKGTTGSTFAKVELTAGEWCSATTRGDRYWLFLVAECCGVHPRI